MGSKQDGRTHSSTIDSSRYFRHVYTDTYLRMISAEREFGGKQGRKLEIGSTGGFLKELVPDLVTTDVRPADGIDLLVDARKLPFDDASVAVIFAKDCLHHIPDITAFLDESLRVLTPGGVIVCVEPYWGPLARVVYRHFHPEKFDDKVDRWTFDSSNPMESNQALMYLLLRRDRKDFETRFPGFTIHELGPVIGPSYLLSGGVDKPFLLPQRLLVRVAGVEDRTRFWRGSLALGFLTVFRKV